MDHKEIIEAYHRDGFAIIRQFISSEELTKLTEVLQGYLRDIPPSATPGEICYEEEQPDKIRCIFMMQERSDYFRQFGQHPRLIDIIEAVFAGADAVLENVQMINKVPYASYRFPSHQDNAYAFWYPPDAVAATLAVDESTPVSGPIVCLKGSHTIGILPHQSSGISGASLELVDPPDTEKFPEVPLCVQPGDLTLHHANVIHYTGPNQTDRDRRYIGFLYRSAKSKRDHQAYGHYQKQLEHINLKSSKPK